MAHSHAPASGPGSAPGNRTDPTAAQLKAAAATFDLLSTPVRLHLVWLAAQGEHDVGTLAARAGVSIATASQHLSKLRLAGVITANRAGKRHIYTVDDPHVMTLIDQIFAHVAPDGTLAPDPPS
ncbi:MAG: transcriptional regulator [Actinoallomurus sp.]|jgi:DNA-binding transcriptional ArsR family regulator|nr:transcriptional regulator [Actinoallomurus sp.]